MKLVSWNVNGLRAAIRSGFWGHFRDAAADVFCVQETKAHPNQLEGESWPEGYHRYWNSAEKKGYSGTAVFTRIEPLSVSYGIGHEEHDREGRVINLEFPGFHLVNVYTPNSQRGLARLEYRTGLWEPAFLRHLKKLRRKKPVVFCGDLNVAHTEIDLANPKSNRRNAGFTDEERGAFSNLLDAGFLDTFREFEKGGGHYTWWSYQSNARARNIGWRIDYFAISPELRPALTDAFIWPHILGSDHCPVGIELEV